MKSTANILKTLAIAAAGFASVPAHALLFVSTGQSNANTQLDVNHTQHWTYTVSADVQGVNGGLFTMKDGPSTEAGATFVIFRGGYQSYLDGSYVNSTVFAQTLGNSAFNQQYDPRLFQNTSINLLAGQTYTGVLFSNTPDAGSTQYFIKGNLDTLTFVDENGNEVSSLSSRIAIASSTSNPSTPTVGGETNVVHEPGSMVLALAGVSLLVGTRRRKFGFA